MTKQWMNSEILQNIRYRDETLNKQKKGGKDQE